MNRGSYTGVEGGGGGALSGSAGRSPPRPCERHGSLGGPWGGGTPAPWRLPPEPSPQAAPSRGARGKPPAGQGRAGLAGPSQAAHPSRAEPGRARTAAGASRLPRSPLLRGAHLPWRPSAEPPGGAPSHQRSSNRRHLGASGSGCADVSRTGRARDAITRAP